MKLSKYLKYKKNIIFIFIFYLIFVLFLFISNLYIKSLLEKNSIEANNKLAIESSYNINSYIDNIFSILSTLSNQLSDDILENSTIDIKKLTPIVLENNFKSIGISKLNGDSYTNSGTFLNVSDRDYFATSSEGKNCISTIVSSKVDGKNSNVFSVPIIKDNNVVGVLWAAILTDTFYEKLNLSTMTKLGESIIINSNGDIIVAPREINSQIDNLNLFDMLNTSINSKNLSDIKNDFSNLKNNYIKLNARTNDNKYTLHYSKLHYNDWWLVSSIHTDTLKMSYSKLAKSINLSFTLFILFVLFLFSIFFIEEKKSYAKLKELSYTDSITNGKNDSFIQDNFERIVNKKDTFAFIALEITNIKILIQILGLKNTEFIVKNIYEYISNFLNEDELIVHSFGLGNFKIIMKYTALSDLTSRLNSIDLYTIYENLDFNMGIYLIDNNKTSLEEICSYTTIAKDACINSKYVIYTKDLQQKEINKFKLTEDIKYGIENKEFKSWFQPKYSRDGKTIVGAETLVRWYKYGSIIFPNIFIPICESNGLIKYIDELVFEDVCINIRRWINEGKNVVPISINLSRSYLNKNNFIETLESYIKTYDIPRNLINFEITESSLIKNKKLLQDTIHILHEKGFKVLLDDFGVGYSSIKAISDSNFDTLKIDKCFVDGIGQEKWNNIIKFTINLSNTLGMNVVAEGIETEEQYKFLLECNCDIFQGYYFNKPMSPDDFSKLI